LASGYHFREQLLRTLLGLLHEVADLGSLLVSLHLPALLGAFSLVEELGVIVLCCSSRLLLDEPQVHRVAASREHADIVHVRRYVIGILVDHGLVDLALGEGHLLLSTMAVCAHYPGPVAWVVGCDGKPVANPRLVPNRCHG